MKLPLISMQWFPAWLCRKNVPIACFPRPLRSKFRNIQNMFFQNSPMKVSCESVTQKCPTRMSHKIIIPQRIPWECAAKASHKFKVLQECRARTAHKSVFQDVLQQHPMWECFDTTTLNSSRENHHFSFLVQSGSWLPSFALGRRWPDLKCFISFNLASNLFHMRLLVCSGSKK